MLNSKYFLGLMAGISVVFIWSFWLVVTRSGVASTLTIYDFAAFRYGLSSFIALPIILYFKPWKTISFIRVVIITFFWAPFTSFAYLVGSYMRLPRMAVYL